MLEKEFSFYLSQQESLLRQYRDKYIVIVGDEIVGSYRSNEIALLESKKKYAMGTFLIQHCTEGNSAYTYTFHSNVIFKNE